MIAVKNTDVFHVHTYRCGHADDIPDEEYIVKALEIGATGIWFTDHAPFPSDRFRNRMRFNELSDYVNTLKDLKARYAKEIDIHIGLEIEYFPSEHSSGYYDALKREMGVEALLLGQHMAETPDGAYTFNWAKDKLKESEFDALGSAIIEGMKTGLFDACAHPDRIFRRKKTWDEDMQAISEKIWCTAHELQIPLEQNESSKREKHHYWHEFWELAKTYPDVQIVRGLDAHSLKEIKLIQ